MAGTRRFSYSAMIVSAKKSGAILEGQLGDSFEKPCFCPENGAAARRALTDRVFDTVIVNAPLPDESGVGLALDAATAGAFVLLLIKNEYFDEICHKTAGSGVFVLAKPFPPVLFRQAEEILLAALAQGRTRSAEIRRLAAKLEEQKSVGLAKCLLIEFCGLTEPQAHRQIEKRAMDTRVSKKEIAEEIIREYGG